MKLKKGGKGKEMLSSTPALLERKAMWDRTAGDPDVVMLRGVLRLNTVRGIYDS